MDKLQEIKGYHDKRKDAGFQICFTAAEGKWLISEFERWKSAVEVAGASNQESLEQIVELEMEVERLRAELREALKEMEKVYAYLNGPDPYNRSDWRSLIARITAILEVLGEGK